MENFGLYQNLKGLWMTREHYEYESLNEAVDITIHTKSPSKWLLIDRETGQVYVANKAGHWDRLDPVIK